MRGVVTVLLLLITSATLVTGGAAQQGTDDGRPTEEPEPSRSTTGSAAADPRSLFAPLVAHPLEPRTFVGVANEDSESFSTRVMAMGLGDLVFVSPALKLGAGSLTVGLSAAVFAQFDIAVSTFDFINADFVVGVPVSFRRHRFSARLRLYHQSSHLGDDFIRRRASVPDQDFDLEAVELVGSLDLGSVRLYGGGERRLRQTPGTPAPHMAMAGIEWRPTRRLAALGENRWLRFVMAAQASWAQDAAWAPARSLRAGLELAPATPGSTHRRLAPLVDFYRGPTTRGQFSPEHTSALGLGLYVGVRP